MGGEREDTEPHPKRAGTEPGLGPSQGEGEGAFEEPAPVDFDALHAALGDLPRVGVDDLRPTPPSLKASSSESHGRSSASYASARPHVIPASLAPHEDPNEPAVIVAIDDTVPVAPPKMTMPIGAPRNSPSGNHRVHTPQSGQTQLVSKSTAPITPQPFFAKSNVGQLTIPMANRPRRPRSPTIVVRPRGPSRQQKLAVFMAMLLLLVAGGVAVVVVLNPDLVPAFAKGRQSSAPTQPQAPAPPSAAAAPPTQATPSPSTSSVPSAAIAPSAAATLAPSASVSASAASAPSVTPSAKPRKKPSTIPVPTPGF